MGLFSKDTPKVSLRCNPEVAKRQARQQARIAISDRKARQIKADALRKADRIEAQMKAQRRSRSN